MLERARRRCCARASCSSIPTDTLYALGGRALDARAAGRVRAAKGRDDDKPLPLIAADLAQAARAVRRLARGGGSALADGSGRGR